MAQRKRFTPLLLLIPAILVAAVVLGVYSYRSAVQLAARTEESVGSSNRVLGLKLIDRIEKVIIDNDRTFFRLVNIEDPEEFVELWRRIIRVSPAVESVMVLDEEPALRQFVAKLKPAERRWFRKVLFERILPEMGLDQLPRDKHKHLHTHHGGKTYLLSFIRRRHAGRDYFIVLSINIRHLIHDVFKEEFVELEESRSIAVMDEGGRVLYGRPMAARDSKLVFEGRFPTTLYKWRLQIAPRDVATLSQEAKARGVLDLAMVAGSMAVILLGLLVMGAAVRKERRANELKSEFIANVSHELKTPLSLIRMFGELLSLGRAADRQTAKDYAEIIIRESDRLTSLIDNVLDFARIERGKAAYDFVVGDLAPVVERAVELCSYRSEQAGVRLEAELGEELPRFAFDTSAMTLLLLNLIENALRYGAAQGGEIHVSARFREQAVVVAVSDDGPGIPEEEQRRVFDRFYRGRSQSRSRGSGIGLSLVKHIAEAHGGTVLVHSQLGKGATFEVTIPV